MTLASATSGARPPATSLSWRDEARHDRSPLALLTMPELQFATPANRTVPVVCKRAAGFVVPIPKFPADVMVTASAAHAGTKLRRLFGASKVLRLETSHLHVPFSVNVTFEENAVAALRLARTWLDVLLMSRRDGTPA